MASEAYFSRAHIKRLLLIQISPYQLFSHANRSLTNLRCEGRPRKYMRTFSSLLGFDFACVRLTAIPLISALFRYIALFSLEGIPLLLYIKCCLSPFPSKTSNYPPLPFLSLRYRKRLTSTHQCLHSIFDYKLKTFFNQKLL